eukprot:9472829-Pyramimonas_sp.AAC.1
MQILALGAPGMAFWEDLQIPGVPGVAFWESLRKCRVLPSPRLVADVHGLGMPGMASALSFAKGTGATSTLSG